jgi:hypothetical protein
MKYRYQLKATGCYDAQAVREKPGSESLSRAYITGKQVNSTEQNCPDHHRDNHSHEGQSDEVGLGKISLMRCTLPDAEEAPQNDPDHTQ